MELNGGWGLYGRRRTERPWLLDLYCGEGGAAVGFYRAGFDVFGVDLNDDLAGRRARRRPKPLRRYPFPCLEADALAFLAAGGWRGFAAIHASPPCQRWSPMTRVNGARRDGRPHPDLIAPTRRALDDTGLPWVMENVERAPLAADAVLLCGSMFDVDGPASPMDVQRHRRFETNWHLRTPVWPCRHRLWAPRFRNHDYRPDRGEWLSRVVPVYGGTRFAGDRALRRRAMEMPWATLDGINEAIPPRFAEFVGRQLLEHVYAEAAA